MCSGSVTDLVDRLQRCIDCGIKTNRIFRTCNIQIDRSRNTDGIDPELRKFSGSRKRSVAADNDKSFYPVFTADFSASLLTFRRPEFHAAGSIEKCAALRDSI